jgi:hypothetical protein
MECLVSGRRSLHGVDHGQRTYIADEQGEGRPPDFTVPCGHQLSHPYVSAQNLGIAILRHLDNVGVARIRGMILEPPGNQSSDNLGHGTSCLAHPCARSHPVGGVHLHIFCAQYGRGSNAGGNSHAIGSTR